MLLSCCVVRAIVIAIMHVIVHGTIWSVGYVDKWRVVFLFAATEEWFKKHGIKELKYFEKGHSKILITDIPSTFIPKISDLPDAPNQLKTFFGFSDSRKGDFESVNHVWKTKRNQSEERSEIILTQEVATHA
jgi:hypothetical protein